MSPARPDSWYSPTEPVDFVMARGGGRRRRAWVPQSGLSVDLLRRFDLEPSEKCDALAECTVEFRIIREDVGRACPVFSSDDEE